MGILRATVWTPDNIFLEPDDKDYDLLDSLECHEHLESLHLDEEAWEAFCEAHEKDLLLFIEQSCDFSGRLLYGDLRRSKLQTAPLAYLRTLDKFLSETSPDALDQVAYLIFWLVRFERTRRTGSPTLTE